MLWLTGGLSRGGLSLPNVLVQRLCARLFLAQWQWLLCWLPAILPVMATLLDFMLSKMAAGGSLIFTRQTWECFWSSPLSVCKKANKTISPTIKLFLQKLNYGEPRRQQTASVAISIFSHYKLLLIPRPNKAVAAKLPSAFIWVHCTARNIFICYEYNV